MKKIIVVSTLFFNKKGNQSLFETMKYYSKNYEVIFITCASKKDSYYYSKEEISSLLPNIKIVQVYQTIPNLLRKFKMLRRKKEVKGPVVSTNLNYTKLNIWSFKIASSFLYRSLRKYAKNCDYICAYEIGAVSSVLKYKKRFRNKKIKYFVKYQGTVLGFSPQDLGKAEHKQNYVLDYEAFSKSKNFDLCAITNDGTHGSEVLKFFGVSEEKIICLPNGISEKIISMAPDIQTKIPVLKEKKSIHLFCLSRLVHWKRVWLSIEIMNKLVNELGCVIYDLNIYGYGNDSEVAFLQNLVIKYNLQEFVSIMGPVDYGEIQTVFNDNHIMLSLYSSTNVTNPVLEAMYIGVPVISIFDEDLNEIVRKTGTNKVKLFKENTVQSLVEDISKFLVNENFTNEDNNFDKDVLSWNKRLDLELLTLEKMTIS